MRLSLSFILLLFSVSAVLSQVADISKRIAISGTVHDADNGGRMAASTVSLQPANRHVETDKDGFFSFGDLEPGDYKLSVQFIGYEELTLPVSAEEDTVIHLYMKPIHLTLSEIMVSGKKRRNREQISALAVREIGRDYLLRNNSTNFVQTLASISGISSMVIGAGFSKPVIRGLGFNRIAVVDKGVVQQNQQWGADHGLEIDQYDVDNVRVHKGPMSLFYGSDAIGGVIEIMPTQIPDHDQFWGDITLIGKSNNDLLGTSVSASRKKGNMFYRGRATIQSYADYRIPTDTIDYLTWKMPVYGRRMKNSAGREYNLSFSSNYSDDNFSSWLHLSNVNAKNGFFPGAHGIPALNRLEHDGSYRNIEMPYSTSNHLKVISNNEWNINNKGRINLDLGYQNKPDGLIGNDDCGQMSAWYMFSAMGFYPVNPVSGELVFGAPQLPKTTLNLDNGKTFTIEAINLSEENMYIEKIELNGSIYTEKFITYDDIMNGGELTFYMTSNQ
jgi:iron complex outermembrane receptor protein